MDKPPIRKCEPIIPKGLIPFMVSSLAYNNRREFSVVLLEHRADSGFEFCLPMSPVGMDTLLVKQRHAGWQKPLPKWEIPLYRINVKLK